ncbi:unknown [Prevotella sp. CAG:604]|nr:unknown [Prevotella sp. CAG:604]
MNKINRLLLGGVLLFCTLPIMSKAYYLCYCAGIENGQKENLGSRIPKRSLYVDYTNYVLTIPDQLLGYTLTVTDEKGDVFSCFVTSNVISLPSNFVGDLEILFTSGNHTFKGIIDAK